jgi:hypothetical protein
MSPHPPPSTTIEQVLQPLSPGATVRLEQGIQKRSLRLMVRSN